MRMTLRRRIPREISLPCSSPQVIGKKAIPPGNRLLLDIATIRTSVQERNQECYCLLVPCTRTTVPVATSAADIASSKIHVYDPSATSPRPVFGRVSTGVEADESCLGWECRRTGVFPEPASGVDPGSTEPSDAGTGASGGAVGDATGSAGVGMVAGSVGVGVSAGDMHSLTMVTSKSVSSSVGVTT